MLNFKCYMESEEDRPTRHRVFTAEKGIFKPKPDHLLGEDPSLAYRITGRPQIDDMLQSGLVRARLGQMRGGRTGETQWTQGHRDNSYSPSQNPDRFVLVTKSENLNNRIGGMPVGELLQVYHSDGEKWHDVTKDIVKR